MQTRRMSTFTDEELVERMKEGDRPAAEALVHRHQKLVGRIVYEVICDAGAVDDLVQDIFMKAFRKAKLYKPAQAKFTVWLAAVARNEAISHLRSAKRSRHVSLDTASPDGGFSPIERPSQQVSKRETWQKVVDAIHGLPEPARTILGKRIIESKSFDEIAKLLKHPVDSIKTVYYRSTESLRRDLGIPGL